MIIKRTKDGKLYIEAIVSKKKGGSRLSYIDREPVTEEKMAAWRKQGIQFEVEDE
jgi:hypothetical protein